MGSNTNLWWIDAHPFLEKHQEVTWRIPDDNFVFRLIRLLGYNNKTATPESRKAVYETLDAINIEPTVSIENPTVVVYEPKIKIEDNKITILL